MRNRYSEDDIKIRCDECNPLASEEEGIRRGRDVDRNGIYSPTLIIQGGERSPDPGLERRWTRREKVWYDPDDVERPSRA